MRKRAEVAGGRGKRKTKNPPLRVRERKKEMWARSVKEKEMADNGAGLLASSLEETWPSTGFFSPFPLPFPPSPISAGRGARCFPLESTNEKTIKTEIFLCTSYFPTPKSLLFLFFFFQYMNNGSTP